METLLKKPLTTTEIKLSDYVFEIKQGLAKDYFCQDRKKYIYRSRISVTLDVSKTSFLFHGSIYDHQNGKAYYNKEEIPFMLYCFLSDAKSGLLSFDDFCNEFGYDPDSRKAKHIHDLCIRAGDKLYSLGLQDEDILCDLLNELSEYYNC